MLTDIPVVSVKELRGYYREACPEESGDCHFGITTGRDSSPPLHSDAVKTAPGMRVHLVVPVNTTIAIFLLLSCLVFRW